MTGDPEPEPVIDLGECRPAGADPPPAGRRAPRRHLALIGAALLAVGFVGGIAVQRAAAPTTAPATTPTVDANRVLAIPTDGTCDSIASGGTDGSYRTGTCVGDIVTVQGPLVTLNRDVGGIIDFIIDSDTRVEGDYHVLNVGDHIIVRLTSGGGGPPHADQLTIS